MIHQSDLFQDGAVDTFVEAEENSGGLTAASSEGASFASAFASETWLNVFSVAEDALAAPCSPPTDAADKPSAPPSKATFPFAAKREISLSPPPSEAILALAAMEASLRAL